MQDDHPDAASAPWFLELFAAGKAVGGPSTPPTGRLIIPRESRELAAHYDLTISHPEVNQAGFEAFDRLLGEAAASRGLSCALIHKATVDEVIRRLQRGRLRIGFHLDYFALWHLADDPFARLTEAVQLAGGWPVNPPARSRLFTDKAKTHRELEAAGLGVPFTVLLSGKDKDLSVSAEDMRRLGIGLPSGCVYLKRANGFGGKEVVRVDNPTFQTVSAAFRALRGDPRQDAVLVQRGVPCVRLHGDDGVERPAYFRVLCCLGEILPFWWNGEEAAQGRPNYRPLITAEIDRLQLEPVLDYVAELAELTELDWFSTELCLSESDESSRHVVPGPDGKPRPVVAIDYVNDQCDVNVQSRWLGAPPDELVSHVAERFAEAAWRTRRLVFPILDHVRVQPAA